MAKKKPTLDFSNVNVTPEQEADMIQRKLSGVFMKAEVEIPWSSFELIVDWIASDLESRNVIVTRADILAKPNLATEYERAIEKFIDDNLQDYMYDLDFDTHSFANRAFSAEIKAEQERQAEERRRQIEAEKEQQRLAQEERKRLEAEGTVFRVDKKHAKKAEAILRAAGYIK